jgi:hypothetical protein
MHESSSRRQCFFDFILEDAQEGGGDKREWEGH